jgi:hypothetical protein
MTRRVTVTECPACGAPVDARELTEGETPACAFCHAPLPFLDDTPRPVVVFQPSSTSPFMAGSAAQEVTREVVRGVRWVVWTVVLVSILVPVGIVLAVVLSMKGSSTPAANTGNGGATVGAPTGNTGGNTGNTGGNTANTGGGATSGTTSDTPGSPVAVGYDLMVPGTHAAVSFTITDATVAFTATCTVGGKNVAFSVPMKNTAFTDPANSNAWYPTPDATSAKAYEGTGVFPDPCGHDGSFTITNGEFNAEVNNNTGPGITGHKFLARWHWNGIGSDGSWSGTSSATM